MKNNLRAFKKSLPSKLAVLVSAIVFGGSLLASGVASAATKSSATAATATPTPSSATSSTTTNNSAARLQAIITKGDQEISRRLNTLSTLTTKISAATKLSAGDKATLTSEVSSTTSGLTTLKTKLDADTTVSEAHTDALSIYTEYRVYALLAPKISLVKVADDQQVVQGKLTTLATSLQTRITADQKAGKDTTTLQTELNDMTSKTSAAQAISSHIESSVINLQPSDYNSNHALLNGDNTQLKTAHSDDATAATDAKNIVAALKIL